jgi:hypothetical protein
MVALKSPECLRDVVSGPSAERVETPYKVTRSYLCFSKGGVDQCELALAANLMVACGFEWRILVATGCFPSSTAAQLSRL